LNSFYPRIICIKYYWIRPAGFGEEFFFLNFSVFLLFRYYLPLEKGYPLCLSKLESLLPKDDLWQVWFKLAKCFWRRGFLYDPTPCLHFCDYLPFEEDLSLYLNKIELPSSKDNLYQDSLNFACWFWRRRSSKMFSAFLLFRYHLPHFTLLLLFPFGEWWSPSFEQTWNPSTQGWCVPSLVKIGLVVLEKESKM
jgi:hypothetical protein